jgi:hypothetical protein
MAPEVQDPKKTAKNSKLPKLPKSRFEPFGKGGWPPISTWIISPLRSRQMLQTMLWAPFSLSTTTSWPIIVRHYQMLSISTLLMKKKCTPLCKPSASRDTTFLGRRQSSKLTISHCSSCRHKENCRITAIKSGPHTCNNSTSTSSIKQEAPIGSLIASVDHQSQQSPWC